MNLLVSGLKEGCVNVTVEHSLPVSELKLIFSSRLSIEPSSYYLTHHGAPLDESDTIGCSCDSSVTLITAHPLLLGGKGGFGSLIRAMGTHINKGINKEACRDLSGRRVRDVNAEKKLAKWVSSEPERKRKRLEEKQKKLERYRNAPKHRFDDPTYMEQIRDVEENMDTALKQGLEAAGSSSSHGVKRGPSEASSSRPSKKAKLLIGLDSEELADSSDSESEDDSPPMLSRSTSPTPSSDEDEPVSTDEGKDTCSSTSQDHPQEPQNADHKQSSVTTDDVKQVNVADTRPDQSSVGEKQESPSEGQAVKKEEIDVPVSTLEDANKPVDLGDYSSAEDLMSVGLDRLKTALQALGLKCGGTLNQRAERLFSTKGKSRDELDPSLFAKGGKQKRKNK